MSRTHLFTGATGFVGSAIILELLARSDDAILCIVRPNDAQSITERLHSTLIQAAESYGVEPSVIDAIPSRCKAIDGDILQENCGVQASVAQEIHFWHCAASLRFEDRHKEAIYGANVDGTRHALSLASTLKAESFNYVSTAYVAGKREGDIEEKPALHDQSNNHYERSKVEAEQLVENVSTMPTRILRPSIVIGHSKTHAALNFNGMYGFLRALVKFKGVMERTQRGLMDRTQLKLMVDPDATLNFIPVDYVATQAVEVFQSGAEGHFHLTNATPPGTGETINHMFDMVGIRRPEYTDSKENFSWLDKKFSQRLDFYESYLIGKKAFKRDRVDAHITTSTPQAYDLSDPVRAQFYRWYLDRLEAERTSLPTSR